MNNIHIEATERSPQVDLDFTTSRLVMRGESYPEDAASFFGPILQALREYLEGMKDGEVTAEIALAYFNSSSAKALMNIFTLLENAAENGNRVVINWMYANDDDTMEEFGHDFADDIRHADFVLMPTSN